MAEHDALGGAGGAGRVDDRVRVAGRDRLAAPVELGAVTAAAPLAEALDRRIVGTLAGVDHEHLLEVLEAAPDLLDLRHLSRVLADHDPGIRVAGDPLALLGRVRRVDRHDHGAGARDREARERPLRPRVREQRHPVAALHPEAHQPERDLVDDLRDLGEGQLTPLLAHSIPDRDPVAATLRRVRGRSRDRPVAGRYGLCRHQSTSWRRCYRGDDPRPRSRSAFPNASFSRSASPIGAPMTKSRPSELLLYG